MVISHLARQSRRFLPFLVGLALLTGCASASNGSLVQRTPQITVTAGRSTTALPSTVPLPSRSVLVQEYAATLNAKTGVAWLYTVAGADQTPASVITFYQNALPTNGWSVVAVPPESAQGKYGGTAIAYQQGNQYAAIAAGIDPHYPRAVVLLITIAPYTG